MRLPKFIFIIVVFVPSLVFGRGFYTEAEQDSIAKIIWKNEEKASLPALNGKDRGTPKGPGKYVWTKEGMKFIPSQPQTEMNEDDRSQRHTLERPAPPAARSPEPTDLGAYVARELARTKQSETPQEETIAPTSDASDHSWKKDFFVLLGLFVVAVIACIVPWVITFQTDKELKCLQTDVKSLETVNTAYRQSLRANESTIFALQSQNRELHRQIEGEPEEDEDEEDHGALCHCPRCYDPPD